MPNLFDLSELGSLAQGLAASPAGAAPAERDLAPAVPCAALPDPEDEDDDEDEEDDGNSDGNIEPDDDEGYDDDEDDDDDEEPLQVAPRPWASHRSCCGAARHVDLLSGTPSSVRTCGDARAAPRTRHTSPSLR